MPVKLNSTGGGSVTLTTPSTATDYTATFPAATGSVVLSNTSGTATVTDFYATNVYASGTVQMGSSFKRNRIINGDMRIDQRNAGASVTPTGTGNANYTLDRWALAPSQASKLSVQQNAGSVTPPAGFSNYLGVTSLSAYSVSATDYFMLQQYIEGFNVADLAWGTVSAVTVTLSFWVRSSLTGTFGGALTNSAQNRCYPFSYTISSASTWEQKTITIAGDTTGTWLTDSNIGIRLNFGLGVGSTYSGTAGSWAASPYLSATGATSVVGTNGATFYITGVQLEEGSVATPYEMQIYSDQLAQCYRYAINLNGTTNTYQPVAFGSLYSNTGGSYILYLPTQMRTTPVLTWSGTLYAQNLNINISSFAGPYSQIGSILEGDFTLASNSTSGNFTFIRWNNVASGSRSFFLSAEL